MPHCGFLPSNYHRHPDCLSVTVAGEGKRPTFAHVLKIAEGAGIDAKQARCIVEEVSAAVAAWSRFADAAGMTTRATREIEQTFITSL